ncbi:8492_t:CDS:2 [Funneliformis mosseae]|uniref:8492_t:CDS:1 n=1 Tax=Funneliformis mosseae TaxID=27381 RepID=A0A9N9GTH3_FUNMO|nr:8492_t:CDS:2 [Funneliformis mosseae]
MHIILSSNDPDTEYFPEDLIDNIPLDSDYSDEEDYPKIQKTISDSSSLPLVLEVGVTLFT